MLEFYIIAGVVAFAAAIALVRPLVQRRDDVLGRDAADARVFRDQLAEIDRDLERGTISEAEAQPIGCRIARGEGGVSSARASGAFRAGGRARGGRHPRTCGRALLRDRSARAS